MAEWIPPKIDYWDTPRPVGGEDLKRIEGNIAALESGEVMPKGVLLRAVPSDEVILEANTQRSARVSEGEKMVKGFAIKYPGTYRLKCEVRGDRDYDGERIGRIALGVALGFPDSSGVSITTTKWRSKNLGFNIYGYGGAVWVYLQADRATVHIRNVKICGTLTMAEPEYAVLQD